MGSLVQAHPEAQERMYREICPFLLLFVETLRRLTLSVACATVDALKI